MKQLQRYWDTNFALELFLLALAVPFMYAPTKFGHWGIGLGLVLLIAGWVWRKMRLGIWYQRTPADWPIFFLLVVMLPVAVWAAPPPLRAQYSWPKALVLLWNFQLFVVIIAHVSRQQRLLVPSLAMFIGIGLLFALIAPLGTNWLFKVPGLEPILSRLPSVLGMLSREGGAGFHPNIVAGALLYVLPLMIALAGAGLRHQPKNPWIWLLVSATLYVTVVFLLLQSRGGYIGLIVALAAMAALPYRRGRWLLAIGAAILGLAALASGDMLLTWIVDNPVAEMMGGTATLKNFRFEVWSAALMATRDFPFTGVGLGAFQEVAMLLYPLNVPVTYYFGHAHNFWLQGAIDFGVPGLVMILAIYITVAVQLIRLWQSGHAFVGSGVVAGLVGCLIAQSLFGLTDAIPMGSTANVMFWFFLAIVLAFGNVTEKTHDFDSMGMATDVSG